MGEGGLADKGLWALIALLIGAVLGWLRRSQGASRARRRERETAAAAGRAEHAAADARQQQQEAQAHADHAAEQTRIDGLGDAGVLDDARQRLERERADGRPSTGLFNGPPADRRRAH